VVRVTSNFAAESPLHPKAREAFLAALDAGWADPRKVSQAADKAAILKGHAIESIASGLGVRVEQVEILGEPCLGHYLALGGLLTPDATLVYGAADRSEVIAVARSHNGPVQELPVDGDGQLISMQPLPKKSVLAFQLANIETGVIQQRTIQADFMAVDATASGPRTPLPEGWSTAIFDAKSWQGPAGLGVLAIADNKRWRSPLPHISSIRVPYSHSLPLLMCAAVSLEAFNKDESHIRELNSLMRSLLSSATIAGRLEQSLPHLLSLCFERCDGEELLRMLKVEGFSADSGSACTAMDLAPSHVLSTMGLPTQGNVRIAIHPDATADDVSAFADKLLKAVEKMQGQLTR